MRRHTRHPSAARLVRRLLPAVVICSILAPTPALLGQEIVPVEPGFAAELIPEPNALLTVACSPGGAWDGIAYFSDLHSGTIRKLMPDGTFPVVAGPFGAEAPFGLAFGPGPGGDFGDYLYFCNPNVDGLSRMDSSGNVTTFVTGIPTASFLAFDASGTYGTDLFVSTGQDIVKVSSSGAVTPFSNADTYVLRFGPGGAWGNLLYAGDAVTFDLLTIATDGTSSVFVPAWIDTLGFDWGQGAGFTGDLIVGGGVGGVGAQLWRVGSDGSHTLFADSLLAMVPEWCGDRFIVGSFGGWVATVRSVFIDLGNGLAGTAGLVPHLSAEGTLLPSDSLDVKLTDGLPFGTAHVVFSFTAINAPFKGGVLVPNPSPSALILALVLDAGGGFAVSSSWPPNVPAGIELYLQVWVQDAGGPFGFAASNAVHQVTP